MLENLREIYIDIYADICIKLVDLNKLWQRFPLSHSMNLARIACKCALPAESVALALYSENEWVLAEVCSKIDGPRSELHVTAMLLNLSEIPTYQPYEKDEIARRLKIKDSLILKARKLGFG